MEGATLQTLTLKVEGMVCGNCAQHVERALAELPGVSSAEVYLEEGRAEVAYDPSLVGPEQMVAAIEEEGYQASPAG